ncbi:MAG: hypothetical protein WBR28_03160 [Mycobacterium sp.]
MVDWHLLGEVGEALGGVGALLTAVVAIVAAIYAKRQLDEAKKARNPQVIAFLDPESNDPQWVDLVFKNFGGRPAIGVKFTIDPRPKESTDDEGNPIPIRDTPLPAEIPLLPPGGEWRTRWDFVPIRAKSELPDRHKVEITYKDRSGREYPKSFNLDFAPLKVGRLRSPT